MYNASVVKFKLIWVIGTRCSFTLDMSLVHNLIVLWDPKLLFCSICCSCHNLATAWSSSHFVLQTSFLAADSNWLLSLKYYILLFLFITSSHLLIMLLIVVHWLSDWIDIIVLQLIFIRQVYVALVVNSWVHTVIDSLSYKSQELFIYI